jgi:hypothetical protein
VRELDQLLLHEQHHHLLPQPTQQDTLQHYVGVVVVLVEVALMLKELEHRKGDAHVMLNQKKTNHYKAQQQN